MKVKDLIRQLTEFDMEKEVHISVNYEHEDVICGTCKEMPTLPKGDNFEIVSHGRVWDVCDDCRQELNKWIESRNHQYAKSFFKGGNNA